MKKLVFILIGILIGVAYSANALPIVQPQLGGTGISATTAGNVGKAIIVSSTSPLVYTFGITGGGGSTTTINGVSGPTFTFNTSSTNSNLSIATSTGVLNFILDLASYLTSAVQTVMGLSTSTINLATSTQSGVYNITASGNTITFTIPPSSDFLASSTTYVATNTGNWIGTWQGVNSSTFYLASNPSGFITTSSITIGGITSSTFQTGLKLSMSATGTLGLATSAISQWDNDSGFITTSTGLGVLNFATTSISQWSNDSGYVTSTSSGVATTTINEVLGNVFTFYASSSGNDFTISTDTAKIYFAIPTSSASARGLLSGADWTTFNSKISTSTYNASITIATTAPLGGGGQLSNGGTITLTCTGCLTSLNGAMLIANNGSDINNTSTFRSSLGLTDTGLQASSTWLKVGNNLSDLNATATARTNIGFSAGTGISIATTGTVSNTGVVSVNGSTGAVTGISTSTGANPTASLGLTANNGTANTFMRSDGSPALSVSITPVWSGLHQFSGLGASTTQLRSASTTLNGITTGTSTFNYGGNINVTGTLTVVGTTTIKANLVDSSGNKYVTSTTAGFSPLPFTVITGATQGVLDNGYITSSTSQIVLTLPVSSTIGSILKATNIGSGGFRIAQNAGQVIWLSNVSTTVGTGGYIQTVETRGDSVEVIAIIASTTWQVVNSLGTFDIN